MAQTAEERRVYQRLWTKRYRARHPERVQEAMRKSGEKRRGSRKGYYAALPEEKKVQKRAACREWRLRNTERDQLLKKRSSLKRAYGITLEQYDAMVAQQGGTCAVCRQPETRAGKQLCVDHCHDTGAVRSLLCSRCNVCIGQLEERPDLLLAAVAYLAKFKCTAP